MNKDKQQVIDLIDSSNHVLITTRHQADYDEVATALAWLYWLKLRNKQADIVIDNDSLKRFDWLPNSHQLRLCEHYPNRYTIRVKINDFKLKDLSYELKDDYLEIYLSPKEGRIKPHDIEHQENGFPYDLVIALGAPDKQSLGNVYEHCREGLQKTPIINIDRRSDNSNFGQFNIIDLMATSLAEISYYYLKDELDKTLAYYLLAGMIAATDSFQSPRVMPETLKIASDLIIAGAPREEIILCLYRNKDVKTLHIWGTALTRLEQDGEIVSSYLSASELNSQQLDWKTLANELILASPKAAIAVLFYEKKFDQTQVRVYAKENYDLMALLEKFNPEGSRRYVEINLNKPRAEAVVDIINSLSEKLKLIGS